MTHDDAKLQAFAFGTCPPMIPTHPTYTVASVHRIALHTHCVVAMWTYIYTTATASYCTVLKCIRLPLHHCTLHCTAHTHCRHHCTILDCFVIICYCTGLHRAALHFTSLHCTVLHCIGILYCNGLLLHCYCIGLHWTALHCSKLLLNSAALDCNVLDCYCTTVHYICIAVPLHCILRLHIAIAYCNGYIILHCIAVPLHCIAGFH